MESIYYIGIAQSLFSSLLIYRKTRKSTADKLLIIWLLVVGVEMVYSLLNLTILTQLPDMIIIPFCYGPFLYFYTLLQINKYDKIPKALLIHLIPVYLFFLITILWDGPISISTINFFGQGAISILGLLNFSLFIASMLFYWIKVLRMIKVYNLNYVNQYAHESTAFRLSWVRSIALWILGSFIVSGILYAVFFAKNIYPFNPVEIYHVGLVIFLYSITYYGVNQPAVYRYKQKGSDNKLQSSQVGDLDLMNRLEEFMKIKKPYLNGELTLHDLAQKLNVDQTELSLVLNHKLQKNFFTYINEFRVNEAKQRIADADNENLTLLAIGYDSGFNSKSSFNALFKKHTGFTPSQYQKQIALKS